MLDDQPGLPWASGSDAAQEWRRQRATGSAPRRGALHHLDTSVLWHRIQLGLLLMLSTAYRQCTLPALVLMLLAGCAGDAAEREANYRTVYWQCEAEAYAAANPAVSMAERLSGRGELLRACLARRGQ